MTNACAIQPRMNRVASFGATPDFWAHDDLGNYSMVSRAFRSPAARAADRHAAVHGS